MPNQKNKKMKKLFVLIITGSLITACGDSAEDVKVENLKSTCDCVEGMNILIEDALDYAGEKSEKDIEKDEEMSKEFEKKMEKMEKIYEHCRKEHKFNERKLDEIKDCEGVEDLKANWKKFEEKF